VPAHPELDDESRRLLSGNSGRTPLSALTAFAAWCLRHEGWDEAAFFAATDSSAILESLCTEDGRYRPQRAASKQDYAWKSANESYQPGAPIGHPVALDNLRREAAKVLAGNDLKVFLGLVDLASDPDSGGNPVLGSVNALIARTKLGRRQVNEAAQRLQAAASADHPVRSVDMFRLTRGPSKGLQTRRWTLNLGYRAPAAGGQWGVNLVSPRMPKLSSKDKLSYFKTCIGNLAPGASLPTRDLCLRAGVPDNSRSREILNQMYLDGEVDRVDRKSPKGTWVYAWRRVPDGTDVAAARAAAAERITADKSPKPRPVPTEEYSRGYEEFAARLREEFAAEVARLTDRDRPPRPDPFAAL
jgi:hypothetical protein